MPPYYPVAHHKKTGVAGRDWRGSNREFATLAEVKKKLLNWNYPHWEISIVDAATLQVVSRSTGTERGQPGWIDVGDGPRENESYPEYLARLRSRQPVDDLVEP